MPRRPLIPIVLLAVLAGLTAWLAWNGERGTTPGGPARSGAAAPRRAVAADAAGRREPMRPGPDQRQPVEPVRGEGELLVACSLAPGAPMVAPFELVAEPVDGGASLELDPTADSAVLHRRLGAGRYRLTVVSGPGDRAGAGISARWVVDPPSDIVDVVPGATTRWTARIVARGDAPERGHARLTGYAFLDGAPAEHLVARIELATRLLATHVAADGSFAFDDVPAGRLRVELCSRILGDSRRSSSSILVYGAAEAAPPAGGIGRVEIHALTATLDGQVLGPDGPAAAAVALTGGRLISPAPGFVDANVRAPVLRTDAGADGHFLFEGLPSGRYEVEASSDSLGGPAVEVEVPPGVPRVACAIRLLQRATLSGTVDTSPLPPPGRGRTRRLSLRLRGPEVVETTVVDGAFQTRALVPGRYTAEFLGRGRGFVVAEPIEVGGAAPPEVHLTPVRG